MKKLFLVAVLLGAPLAGCNVTDDAELSEQALNVNSRYLIESVHLSGRTERLSSPLQSEINRLQGQKYDDSMLRKLADRIKRELRATDVSVNVKKGLQPEHVVVNFEVKSHEQPVDLKLAKFMYDSKQGWSGDGSATTVVGGNAFTFGLVSDADALVERFTGIRAKFERKSLGTDRLGIRFEFDSFHEQWNQATLAAMPANEIYRTRQMFTPEATWIIAQPLELSFGVSFARYRPSLPAAKTGSANAVVTTLRYHQRWGSDQEIQQEANADYSLRAATHFLETDAVYSRHEVRGHYKAKRGKSSVEVGFLAGRIDGNAPLYERFALGNASTLRGWNKFDLDPVGGSRAVHGSIDYHFDIFTVFYDTGAVWDQPQNREQKQSVGAGFNFKKGFQLAVAFPLRAGHTEPIFYAGMNF
jgi:hypothetical protein